MTARDELEEIAGALNAALPGGYRLRPDVEKLRFAGGSLPLYIAALRIYVDCAGFALYLPAPAAEGRLRETEDEACASLLDELGATGAVVYRSEGAGVTLRFPVARSAEEVRLRLAVEGCGLSEAN